MPDVPLIQLNRLTKRFGGVTALDGVSFDIRGGEVHAVVGADGFGESQIVKGAGAQLPGEETHL
jgi:ribose transport system ATP-binding protein